jgi:hypothetical protein
MKLNKVFNELMRKHHRQAVLLGGARASTPEEFFGFDSSDVETVHFHRAGEGSTTPDERRRWFRLHCGRVVDELAKPCANDPEIYDYGAKWSYA